MDKTGILGDTLEQLGGVIKQSGKQVAKASVEIAKGAAVQTGVAPAPQVDINNLKTSEEEKTATNLAVTRQRLAEMMAPKPSSTPRPAKKVEGEKQQEMAQLRQKEAKKPPPLAIQRKQRFVETRFGPAG